MSYVFHFIWDGSYSTSRDIDQTVAGQDSLPELIAKTYVHNHEAWVSVWLNCIKNKVNGKWNSFSWEFSGPGVGKTIFPL